MLCVCERERENSTFLNKVPVTDGQWNGFRWEKANAALAVKVSIEHYYVNWRHYLTSAPRSTHPKCSLTFSSLSHFPFIGEVNNLLHGINNTTTTSHLKNMCQECVSVILSLPLTFIVSYAIALATHFASLSTVSLSITVLSHHFHSFFFVSLSLSLRVHG